MNYHVIVARPEDGSVLALPSSGGWTVPSFESAISDSRIVEHINSEMRRQLGFETWTVKCAGRGETDGRRWRLYFATVRGSNVSLPIVEKWLGRTEASAVGFDDAMVWGAVEKWFYELDNPSPLSSPWESAGWFAEACIWIHSQLDALGFTEIAPITQQRVWGLSCTMKVGTDKGDVYFKGTPPFMAHEGSAMRAVVERCPDLLPAPLAVDSERGWVLMPDYGGEMLHECPDIARWEEALLTFSRVQVEQVERIGYWLSRNIPDRRLGRMAEMVDPLIASCESMLAGGVNGLSGSEVDALRSLSMPLKLMCARLAQYAVPHTLVHGDLGGNILIRDEGYTFFDWTDVCVSHPFFEMVTISGAYFDESVLKDNPDAEIRLRDAYLKPWAEVMPMERLVEAFEASRPLGALHQAMSYMWILTNVSPDARPELEGGLLHWVRNLLRLCGKGS